MNLRDAIGVAVGLSPRQGYEWPSETAPIWGVPAGDTLSFGHSNVLVVANTLATIVFSLAWMITDHCLFFVLAMVSLGVQTFSTFRFFVGSWLVKRSLRHFDRRWAAEQHRRGS